MFDIDKILSWDVVGEVYSSILAMIIIAILYIVMGILARHHDPLKKSRGLLLIGEILVGFFDHLVTDLMGPKFKNMGGFVMAIASYLFIAFIFGLTGFPSPITYMAIPLSCASVTFVMIHATSVRFTKWKYFKRYIDPLPVFLPINLLSMWSPLLSLTLRMFGNAMSGWVIMSLLYGAFNSFGTIVFTYLGQLNSYSYIAPLVTPVLHLYFDFFSGFIQTTVFIFLTMIYISQEAPEDEIESNILMEGGR